MTLLWLCSAVCSAAAAEWVPGNSLFDEALTEYKGREAAGALPALAKRLAAGETRLESDPKFGYLPALLRELDIPGSSQVLVYSKTSARKNEVSPKTPRALYFNERASVAFYPGSAELEIASADPNLGVAFYRLEGSGAGQPRLTRDDRCMECHLSMRTFGVPGWMVRSFLTGGDGDVDPLNGKPMVTHRTRIEDRWGGYYVTGTHGDQVHLGNVFSGAARPGRADPAAVVNGNVTNLAPYLDVSRYPEPGSDIVSLLVLDHQACMNNLLIRLRFEAELLKNGKNAKSIEATSEAVLRYLLFVDEVHYKAPIRGTSGFAAEFQKRGPRDAQGRSLRELDLATRLFKYPCSYMIYSDAFDQLPETARRHLYRRLWEVLTGEDVSPDFQRIPAEKRQAVREILNATKKDLPMYWRL